MDEKRVAIVTDIMVSFGGADRLIMSLLKLFPQADIYTAIYDPKDYTYLKCPVYATFLQKSFFKKIFKRSYNLLSSFAFEALDMRKYDIVLSVSAGCAKGVVTGINTQHIGIINTPPRYIWDYAKKGKMGAIQRLVAQISSNFLRVWDYNAVKRIDDVISISRFIQTKVRKVYGLDSQVVYPGVSKEWFEESDIRNVSAEIAHLENYFVIVSRLHKYKNIELPIKIFNSMSDKKLVIAGTGPEEKYLKKIASSNVKFLGFINEDEIKYLYSKANALIFPGIDDFGYVPVEAMAQSCPVIYYNSGGVTETVIDGRTGIKFDSEYDLANIIRDWNSKKFVPSDIIARAKQFSEEAFIEKIKKIARI